MVASALKVEKIVKDAHGNITYDEKEGMAQYYLRFLHEWDQGHANEQKLIDALIGYFVDHVDFRVTYSGAGGGASLVARKGGGGFDPDIKAVKDSVGGSKKFHITVPSEKPDSTAQYVSDMITNINGTDNATNQQYLTGLLLMRKCR